MTDAQPHILIVDDDKGLQETLADFLELEGYGISTAGNVAEARVLLLEQPADLILLDLNMPGGDGLTYAAELRAGSDIPIIMMSGKGEMIDRVVGLEVGADDYLPKPFELRELLARVRALLRRSTLRAENAGAAAQPAAGRSAKVGSWFTFHPEERQLRTAAGDKVDLTGAEYQLLEVFIERPGRVLTRSFIADCVQGADSASFDRSVDTLVSRLRRKLTVQNAEGLVQTVRGEGYVFAAPITWQGD